MTANLSRLLPTIALLLLCADAHPLSAQSCTLEYQRADNMWADVGRPDGALGKESIGLPMGAKKVLATDWKYEKKRNDGTNYYGSHLRIVTNKGTTPVEIVLAGGADLRNVISGSTELSWNSVLVTIAPGVVRLLKADLGEVRCPKA